jgi:alkylation response protein AidB-like acyl-CoA dehydrogenase
MKAHVEGMRSFIYYVGSLLDRKTCIDDQEKSEYYQGLIDLLTPVIKSYCSDRGFDICTEAIQVFGGYGYMAEYPVEKLMRDSKIYQIYEGTSQIQREIIVRELFRK